MWTLSTNQKPPFWPYGPTLLLKPLLLQVFTDSTNLPIFLRFNNIHNFRSFRKNCSSRSLPFNPVFYRFLVTRLILEFSPDFTIFAIFAAYTKIVVLVGALSTSSSTSFHWFHEVTMFRIFYNIRNFRSFRKNYSYPWALSTSFSTGFHWLHEIYNFSQILQYSQFSQTLRFLSEPSQSLLLQYLQFLH